MATIAEHVGTVRHLIKDHVDDSYYSDEFLYFQIKTAAALLKEREAKKFTKISDFTWQPICMPLTLDYYHNCDCLPEEYKCKVLRSVYPIPNPIMGRNRHLLKVTTLEGKSIDYMDDVEEFLTNAYSITKKDSLGYTIFDNYIWVLGTTTLGVIQINGIFESPEALALIPLCDSDGEPSGGICYNVTSDDFPIKASLHKPMYEEVMKLLRIPLQIKEDLINDAIDSNG